MYWKLKTFVRLSIIIVSYNVRALLRRCLQSVCASAQLSADWLTVDVTVVDNASRDNSAQMVAAEFPHLNLLASSDNLGFARANNLALRRLGFGSDRAALPLSRPHKPAGRTRPRLRAPPQPRHGNCG